MADAALELQDRGVLVLQEKLYGEAAQAETWRDLRESAWRARGMEPDTPVTIMGAPPARGGELAGLQFTGVALADETLATVETLRQGSHAVGRTLTAGELRLVYLADLHGLGDAGPALNAPDQAAAMFNKADALLRAFDLRYTQVARTWIYVSRLLDWYDDLNKVRTDFFSRVGVINAEGRGVLPASTGIQGHHPHGAECFMDLVAISSQGQKGRAFSQIRSSHQCEASDYGSSFSRGVELPVGDSRLLYISGTASINLAGETVHQDDDANQILEALTAAGMVMSHAGTSLEQVVTGVGFHKTAANFAAWQALEAQGTIPTLPMVQVLADVCRHDLLFEVEPVAIL